MRLILKRKQQGVDADFAKVWADPFAYYSEAEVDTLAAATLEEMAKVISPYVSRGPVVYGWSGGKDSVALEILLSQLGEFVPVLGTIPALEWPRYMSFVTGPDAPPGLVHYANHAVTLATLAAPPGRRRLFPDDAQGGYWWTLNGTRRAQALACKQLAPSLFVMGRRTADGNVCPKDGLSRSGELPVHVYQPIRSWPHEAILALIRRHGRRLPETYAYPNAWTAGTGTWAGQRLQGPATVDPYERTVRQFLAVARCDRSVVVAAAELFPEANEALLRL